MHTARERLSYGSVKMYVTVPKGIVGNGSLPLVIEIHSVSAQRKEKPQILV